MTDADDQEHEIGRPRLLGGGLVVTDMEKELLALQHGSDVEYFEEKICFLGHSHQPFIIESTERHRTNTFHTFTEVGINQRYIVNAGSVGQPRDANPDASYVILKDNRIEIKRVSYDIVLTQNKMKKAGLPEYLIERLAAGR